MVKGFQFHFGLGGIHGSINNAIVKSDDDYVVVDLDVTSYYPYLAIKNKVFPAHLTEKFCDIYNDIMEQRKVYEEGTPENAIYKLAANASYGMTNNIYSSFYDPLYTMTITINGQLLLCQLAEHLLRIDNLMLVQANTDGLTVKVKRTSMPQVDLICDWWMNRTQLKLEYVHYKAMYIRDVNNYLAVSEDGKIKRKGAYRSVFDSNDLNKGIGNLDWNENHSALVIPKLTEYMLLDGTMTIEEVINGHENLYDFCLRTKVPRNSKLLWIGPDDKEIQLQNVCRYYISQTGGDLVKLMPPLHNKVYPRRIGINVGWKVTPCNNIKDAVIPIDYNFYIQEIRKLVEPLRIV